MMENIAYIYALVDPTDNEIRYIGKSVNPKKRLSGHLYHGALKNEEYRSRWIKKVLKKNLRPKIIIVQEVNEKYWEECEIYWIKYFKSIGCRLTNTDLGGRGGTRGYKRSQKTISRWKRSRSISNYKPSKESLKRGIETKRRNGDFNFSEKTKKKMSESAKRKPKMSDETKEKLRIANSGKKPTKEAVLKRKIKSAKKGLLKSNYSGAKGVCMDRSKNKWKACFKGKHLGYFNNVIDAAKAYDKALIEEFGEDNCTTNKLLGLY